MFDGLSKRLRPSWLDLVGTKGVADYIARNEPLCWSSEDWDQDVITGMKSWGTRSQDSLPDGSALNENHWRHEMIDKIASRPLCLLKTCLADQEESVPSTERALSRSEIKGILTFPANTQRVVLSRGENLLRNVEEIIECQQELSKIKCRSLRRKFRKESQAPGAWESKESLGPL